MTSGSNLNPIRIPRKLQKKRTRAQSIGGHIQAGLGLGLESISLRHGASAGKSHNEVALRDALRDPASNGVSTSPPLPKPDEKTPEYLVLPPIPRNRSSENFAEQVINACEMDLTVLAEHQDPLDCNYPVPKTGESSADPPVAPHQELELGSFAPRPESKTFEAANVITS